MTGVPHDHSWVNGGRELHTAVGHERRRQRHGRHRRHRPTCSFIKTGNSAFRDFVTDRYRTLPDADDRIVATSVTADVGLYWPNRPTTSAAFAKIRTAHAGDVRHAREPRPSSRQCTRWAGRRWRPYRRSGSVSLRLPNKHRIPFDLSRFGLTNGNDIFVWTDEPFGDITAEVERD